MNKINNMSVNAKIAALRTARKREDDPCENEAIDSEIGHLLTRKDAIQWMSSFPIKYHLTITSNKNLNEYKSELYANSLLKMIRNEYFGSNKRKDFFDGLVIKEKQKNGDTHYHILIINSHMFEAKRNRGKVFKDVIKKKCDKIIEKYPDKSGRVQGSHPIHPKRGLHLQNYFEGNLEEYLTKTLESANLDFDFIAPLSYDGFCYVEKASEVSFARRSRYDKSLDGNCRIYRFRDTGRKA